LIHFFPVFQFDSTAVMRLAGAAEFMIFEPNGSALLHNGKIRCEKAAVTGHGAKVSGVGEYFSHGYNGSDNLGVGLGFDPTTLLRLELRSPIMFPCTSGTVIFIFRIG
jgi:hypothetical protein